MREKRLFKNSGGFLSFWVIAWILGAAVPGGAAPISIFRRIELDKTLIPVQGSSPELGDEDLEAFSDLGNLEIVGLGEATHGTKEFFEMKHRIFAYFVARHGTRAFGFECDFGESIFLDRYVTRGEGNLKALMSEKMHFWTWHTEEVRTLLEWMRTYNDGRPEDEKIHYLGFDCQFATFQASLLREYIQRFMPEIPPSIEAILSEAGSLKQVLQGSNFSSSQRDEWAAKFEVLGRFLVENEAAARSVLGRWDYELAGRLIRAAIQAFQVRFETKNGIPSSRDFFMAENALWMERLFQGGGPLVLWAHNGHVAKDPGYGGGSMGCFLQKELGPGYQVAGFSFGRGSFTAVGDTSFGVKTITDDPLGGSVNHLFDRAWSDDFILRLDRLNPGGPLISWLRTPRLFFSVGAYYNGQPNFWYAKKDILGLYDILIHFSDTHAAEQMSRSSL